MKKPRPFMQACASSARMFFCDDCKHYCPDPKNPQKGICKVRLDEFRSKYISLVHVSGYDENCKDFESGTYTGKQLND